MGRCVFGESKQQQQQKNKCRSFDYVPFGHFAQDDSVFGCGRKSVLLQKQWQVQMQVLRLALLAQDDSFLMWMREHATANAGLNGFRDT
jgi:hypothetical protein